MLYVTTNAADRLPAGAAPCRTTVKVGGEYEGVEFGVQFGGGGGSPTSGDPANEEGFGQTSADARASGTVLCGGPYSVQDTAAAIASDSQFKQALLDRARKAGDDPSSWSDVELALTAVHGAHGGKDCVGNSPHDDAYRALLAAKFPNATTDVPGVTNDPVESGGGSTTTTGTGGGGGDNVIDEVLGWLEDTLGATPTQQQPQTTAAGLGMTEILLIALGGVVLVLAARQFS